MQILLDGIRTFVLKKESKYMHHTIEELRSMCDYDSAKMSQVHNFFSFSRYSLSDQPSSVLV